MLRIGICDDAAAARLALHSALERLSPSCVCYEFSSGEGLLSWLVKHPNTIDLLFLDIEMGQMSGMDVARAIRAQDQRLHIVFLTGYAVRALDYLLKPLSMDKLSSVLERAAHELENDAPETFSVHNSDGLFRVPKRDILYCYSDRRQVHLIARTAEYTFYDKLDQVEAALGAGFVRIHQRYLVRISAIDRIEDSAVFLGNLRLPISRANRAAVMAACARGMLEDF